jgi:hypothetical protein
MIKFMENKVSENPKKVWSIPSVEIISDGDIESHLTSKYFEGQPTAGKGTAKSGGS